MLKLEVDIVRNMYFSKRFIIVTDPLRNINFYVY